MTKNKRTPSQNRNAGKKYDLSMIHDTSSTMEGTKLSQGTSAPYSGSYEQVDPPFGGVDSRKEKSAVRNDFGFWFKIFGSILAFVITVGGSVVWYASRLSTNVDNLQTDVKEVKVKIEKLSENSIRQSERLEKLETGIGTVNIKQPKPQEKRVMQ